MASREKQLKRLKKDALRLWSDQQELLTRANSVARDALPYATEYAKGRVGPTAATLVPSALSLLDERVKPTVGRGAAIGAAAGKAAASTARDALVGTVVPALSSVASAALSLADEASGRLGVPGDAKKVVAALGDVTKQGEKTQRKAALKVAAGAVAAKGAAKAAKNAGKAAKGAGKAAKAARSGGIGVGGTIGILVVLTALAGIGYAIWQTLRADDDLWVADDEVDTTTGGGTPGV